MSDSHPIGVFNDVEIIDHGWDKSKDKGTPFLWIVYQSTHGKITGRHYVTQGTIERFSKMLTDIGFTGSSLKDPALSDGTALQGMACQITVANEEYDGKLSPRVQWVNANNSTGGANRLSGGEIEQTLDAFDLLFKKATGQLGAGGKDDCPF